MPHDPTAAADATLEEIPLIGGDVTDGLVRVGDTVRRPRGPHSVAVARVLEHLEEVGFDGAPRWLGVDDQGRDTLSFIEGEVATRPYPRWVADDDRAVSVARLLRRLDDAMISFGLPHDVSSAVPRPKGAPQSLAGPHELWGHRDVTPENVVFRDGEAFALIDFDLVRPSTRLEEVTSLLTWWAPWCAPEDRDPALRGVSAFHRGRLLVDAYGVPMPARAHLVPLAINSAERSWFRMRDRAENEGGGWRRMWDAGVGRRIRHRIVWLRDNEADLTRSLTQ